MHERVKLHLIPLKYMGFILEDTKLLQHRKVDVSITRKGNTTALFIGQGGS